MTACSFEEYAADRIRQKSKDGRVWTTTHDCFPDRSAAMNVRLANRLRRAGVIEIDRSFRIRSLPATSPSIAAARAKEASASPVESGSDGQAAKVSASTGRPS